MNGHKLLRWLGVPVLAIAGLVGPVGAQDVAPPAEEAGLEVLTRGPIHEAFAEPVIYDPKPGPVISKPPPEPVEELPPDQKPEGENVQWIPGYWAWDDSRNDYIWLSGIWRDIPPDRQWVPGYWSEVEGGYQWTPGAWVSTEQSQVEYLPDPPQSLEVGPSGPAPSEDATWSPGYWDWQESRYAWRPGFWVPFQPDWTWVPAHYVWSPYGCLFVDAYWDRPLLRRGLPFAPVFFQQPLYRRPNFRYTPSIGLVASALASSLFVRPAYNQYYFGDYYAANNFQSGIYPWYSFHQSRYGYDPLFSHYASINSRRDPRWLNKLHDEYRFRRDHPDARPPHTWVQQQSIINNINNIRNVTRVQNLVVARPLGQLAAREAGAGGGLRFQRIDEARRRDEARQAAQLQQFRQQRLRQEREGARRLQAGRARSEPRRLDFPRSPVAAAIRGGGRRDERGRVPLGAGPPPRPSQPRPDLNVRPPVASQFRQPRPDPDPDRLPPRFRRDGRAAERPGQPGVERREALRPALPKRQEPRKDQVPPGVRVPGQGPGQGRPGARPGADRKDVTPRPALPKRQEPRKDVTPRPALPKRQEPRRDQVPPGLRVPGQGPGQGRPGARPGADRRDDTPRPALPKRQEPRKDQRPPSALNRNLQPNQGRPSQAGVERREALRPALPRRQEDVRPPQAQRNQPNPARPAQQPANERREAIQRKLQQRQEPRNGPRAPQGRNDQASRARAAEAAARRQAREEQANRARAAQVAAQRQAREDQANRARAAQVAAQRQAQQRQLQQKRQDARVDRRPSQVRNDPPRVTPRPQPAAQRREMPRQQVQQRRPEPRVDRTPPSARTPRPDARRQGRSAPERREARRPSERKRDDQKRDR